MAGKYLDNDQSIVDFKSVRSEKIEERRREYERVLFKNTLGVYTVIKQKGLHAIEVLDISEGGLSFQVSEKSDLLLQQGETLDLRVYISGEYYLPVEVKIIRCISAIDNGRRVRHYGCIIDKGLASYAAIFHFIQFISKCAEHAHKDDDHLKIFY